MSISILMDSIKSYYKNKTKVTEFFFKLTINGNNKHKNMLEQAKIFQVINYSNFLH